MCTDRISSAAAARCAEDQIAQQGDWKPSQPDMRSEVDRAADDLRETMRMAGINPDRADLIALVASHWRAVSTRAHRLHDAIRAETA